MSIFKNVLFYIKLVAVSLVLRDCLYFISLPVSQLSRKNTQHLSHYDTLFKEKKLVMTQLKDQ